MTDCTHPRLIHVVNPEMGASASTTYKCQECETPLTVTIKPFEIRVPGGVPPLGTPWNHKVHASEEGSKP